MTFKDRMSNGLVFKGSGCSYRCAIAMVPVERGKSPNMKGLITCVRRMRACMLQGTNEERKAMIPIFQNPDIFVQMSNGF